MRGTDELSGSLVSYVNLKELVPRDLPLRAIRRREIATNNDPARLAILSR